MLTKLKVQRRLIHRVIMGPPEMFAEHTIRDEVSAFPTCSPWGMLMEKRNSTDPSQFLAHVYPDAVGDEDFFIGRVVPGQPSDLTSSAQWTDENFLSFGKTLQARIWDNRNHR